jgi:hypothetical protein
MASSPLVV